MKRLMIAGFDKTNRIWEGGTWHEGLIHSKKYSRDIESKVNPAEFYRIEKESTDLKDLQNKVK